jgi:hypothetical protein
MIRNKLTGMPRADRDHKKEALLHREREWFGAHGVTAEPHRAYIQKLEDIMFKDNQASMRNVLDDGGVFADLQSEYDAWKASGSLGPFTEYLFKDASGPSEIPSEPQEVAPMDIEAGMRPASSSFISVPHAAGRGGSQLE